MFARKWHAPGAQATRSLVVAFALVCAAAPGYSASEAGVQSTAARAFESLMRDGDTLAREGNLDAAIGRFTQARTVAPDAESRAAANGELGAVLVRAGRYIDARAALKDAYEFGGPRKAARAIDLGNLALSIHKPEEARALFTEAKGLAGTDVALYASANLNLARSYGSQAPEKLALLQETGTLLLWGGRKPAAERYARLMVNVGHQASALGPDGRQLALSMFTAALADAHTVGAKRAQAEALAELGLLDEREGRADAALARAREGLALVYALPPRGVADLKISLEFLQGRRLQALGHSSEALRSFQLAAEAIESVRQEMPIEDEDGRSTYQTTIDPVTRGLVGLLADQSMMADATQGQHMLSLAVQTEEQMHQAEMQDFLGDRCTVEIGGSGVALLRQKVAVIYPVLMDDRVELLMRTANGITHRRVGIARPAVKSVVEHFAANLRDAKDSFLPDSRKLYNWLIGPLEEEIVAQGVTTLVFVPDADLHMVPFAALNDGKQYAIEKYAVAGVAGITMTNLDPRQGGSQESLVAGMAEPGPVVGKLDRSMISGILGTDEVTTRSLPSGVTESAARQADGGGQESGAQKQARATELLARIAALKERSLGGTARAVGDQDRAVGDQGRAVGDADRTIGDQERKVGDQDRKVGETARLKAALALPGVRDELAALKPILPGRQMVDSSFTRQDFGTSAGSGDYGIVHIASHGFFGGSADSSFLLAYDDLLTMSQLQTLLTTEKTKQNPIDLLTLSACETAEGNARAPLGIAGAGIKARARSVVGTLWPVDDDASKIFMESFYRGVIDTKLSKAEAIRQAQLALLRNKETAHPTFWGPFTLIGNWQ